MASLTRLDRRRLTQQAVFNDRSREQLLLTTRSLIGARGDGSGTVWTDVNECGWARSPLGRHAALHFKYWLSRRDGRPTMRVPAPLVSNARFRHITDCLDWGTQEQLGFQPFLDVGGAIRIGCCSQ